jgi:hypothetical protein
MATIRLYNAIHVATILLENGALPLFLLTAPGSRHGMPAHGQTLQLGTGTDRTLEIKRKRSYQR